MATGSGGGDPGACAPVEDNTRPDARPPAPPSRGAVGVVEGKCPPPDADLVYRGHVRRIASARAWGGFRAVGGGAGRRMRRAKEPLPRLPMGQEAVGGKGSARQRWRRGGERSSGAGARRRGGVGSGGGRGEDGCGDDPGTARAADRSDAADAAAAGVVGRDGGRSAAVAAAGPEGPPHRIGTGEGEEGEEGKMSGGGGRTAGEGAPAAGAVGGSGF